MVFWQWRDTGSRCVFRVSTGRPANSTVLNTATTSAGHTAAVNSAAAATTTTTTTTTDHVSSHAVLSASNYTE